jgi:hypothetical protein
MRKLLAFAAISVSAICGTAPAYPDSPTPAPTPVATVGPLHWAAYAGTGTIVGRAARTMFVFSQVMGSYHTAGCATAYGRAEAAALGDGGSKKVVLTDPSTFTSLEVEIGGACERVTPYGTVSIGGFYGDVIDTDNGALKIVTSAPKTYGALATLGTERDGKFLSVGLGAHQSAGPGLKGLFAAQYPVKGSNLSALVDGAIGGPLSFIRLRMAVGGGK